MMGFLRGCKKNTDPKNIQKLKANRPCTRDDPYTPLITDLQTKTSD